MSCLQLIEALGEVDEEIAELFLLEQIPTPEQFSKAIRRATLALKFVPGEMVARGQCRLFERVVTRDLDTQGEKGCS